MEEVIAVFIPIVITIVTGIVLISYFYQKSRENQLMIEKGLSAEQIVALINARHKDKNRRYFLLKGGIIIIFLVIGGIIGSLLDQAFVYGWKTFSDGSKYYADDPVYAVWLAFLGIGIGAVTAHFVSLKYEKNE